MLRSSTHTQQRRFWAKKPLIFGGIIVLVGLLVVGGLFWHHNNTKPNVIATNKPPRGVNSVDYSPSQPSDNTANEQRKSNPSTAASTLNNGSTTTTQPSSLAVTVTRAGIVGNSLQVGTIVSGTTSGTCTVNVSQTGQKTVTASEAVQQGVNSYSCPVFNLPLSSFPNRGNWNVSVTLTDGSSSKTAQWQGNPVALTN